MEAFTGAKGRIIVAAFRDNGIFPLVWAHFEQRCEKLEKKREALKEMKESPQAQPRSYFYFYFLKRRTQAVDQTRKKGNDFIFHFINKHIFTSYRKLNIVKLFSFSSQYECFIYT